MAEAEREPRECSAALVLAFSVLGKRWNGMILEALGAGPLSFVRLRRAVTGISDAVLSDRLTELAGAGLVLRRVEDGPPVAVGYELTAPGRRLVPVLEELADWAGSNLAPGGRDRPERAAPRR